MTRSRLCMFVASMCPTAAAAATLTVPVPYASVGDAIAASADGDSIVVLAGDFSSENIALPTGIVLGFIGAGPGLTTLPQFSANDANLTFEDVSLPCASGPSLDVLGGDSVTLLDNVELDNCVHTGHIINARGSLTILNSHFSNTTIDGPGLISGRYGDVLIENSTFDSLVSVPDAGCVATEFPYCSGGAAGQYENVNITVRDSEFNACEGDFGACISIKGGHAADPLYSWVDIINNTFTNSIGLQGGSLLIEDFLSVTIIGSRFDNNRATGGGIVVLNSFSENIRSSALMIDVALTDNSVVGDAATFTMDGFAADSVSGELVEMYGSRFCGNANFAGPTDVRLNEINTAVFSNHLSTLGTGTESVHLSSVAATITNSTFAGLTGDGLRQSSGQYSRDIIVNSTIFSDIAGVVAVDDGGGNTFGSFLGHHQTSGWSGGFLDSDLNVSAVEADPQFVNYVSGVSTCADVNLWLAPSSPMRDAGDPGLGLDPDGSVPDIGVYGGPGARLDDGDLDGVFEDLDCNDADASIHPGAAEIAYDGADQDCDGADLDDVDGDGEVGEQAGGPDCNDNDTSIGSFAVEIWYDGEDENCDDLDDFDQDGDGETVEQFGGTDCDDLDPAINTAASEIWYDDVDQNCDGLDDHDQDGDGFAALSGGGIDCDDTTVDVGPGVEEIWYDGVDQDCDGADDDQDGDGYDLAEDCDDTEALVNPGMSDLTEDGVDQDCDDIDGIVDGRTNPSTETGTDGNDEPTGCGCSQAGRQSIGWSLLLPLFLLRRRQKLGH